MLLNIEYHIQVEEENLLLNYLNIFHYQELIDPIFKEKHTSITIP